MSERDDTSPPGVKEAVTAWEAPAVLHARPVEGPVDWDAAVQRVFERFPKTLARLAE